MKTKEVYPVFVADIRRVKEESGGSELGSLEVRVRPELRTGITC